MSEKWVEWNPIINLDSKLYINKINFKSGVLSIDFKSVNVKVADDFLIRCVFDSNMLSYRITNESYFLSIINNLSEQFLLEDKNDILQKKTFFKVLNSHYIAEFIKITGLENDKIIHYSFVGINFILDVLAHEEPLLLKH